MLRHVASWTDQANRQTVLSFVIPIRSIIRSVPPQLPILQAESDLVLKRDLFSLGHMTIPEPTTLAREISDWLGLNPTSQLHTGGGVTIPESGVKWSSPD